MNKYPTVTVSSMGTDVNADEFIVCSFIIEMQGARMSWASQPHASRPLPQYNVPFLLKIGSD